LYLKVGLYSEKLLVEITKPAANGIGVRIGVMEFYRYIDSRNRNTELWGELGTVADGYERRQILESDVHDGGKAKLSPQIKSNILV
jgi:hypothetical protein